MKELLDVAEKLFPHPGEANPPPFVKGSGSDAVPIEARPDPAAHVIADVFKIVNDPFVGKLGIFRVYQGTVKKDGQLFVDDGKKPFKVAHLFKLKGKGIQRLGGRGRGDQYVRVTVEVPKNLNGKQKELIKQLDGATGDKNYAKRRNFFDKIKKMFNE